MLLNVKQVMEILQCKQSHAYNAIRELNKELEEKGKRTRRGLVLDTYLFERYGLDEEECKEFIKKLGA